MSTPFAQFCPMERLNLDLPKNKKETVSTVSSYFSDGGDKGIRTPGLLNAIQRLGHVNMRLITSIVCCTFVAESASSDSTRTKSNPPRFGGVVTAAGQSGSRITGGNSLRHSALSCQGVPMCPLLLLL